MFVFLSHSLAAEEPMPLGRKVGEWPNCLPPALGEAVILSRFAEQLRERERVKNDGLGTPLGAPARIHLSGSGRSCLPSTCNLLT